MVGVGGDRAGDDRDLVCGSVVAERIERHAARDAGLLATESDDDVLDAYGVVGVREVGFDG